MHGLGGVLTGYIGGAVADADFKGFPAEFETTGNHDRLDQPDISFVGQVEVSIIFVLDDLAEIEALWRIGAERGVDGLAHEIADHVSAGAAR